jgi:hypothetical protein
LKSPWRNFLTGYWWGSNSVTLGAVSTLVMADRAAGYASRPDVLDAAPAPRNVTIVVDILNRVWSCTEGALEIYGSSAPSCAPDFVALMTVSIVVQASVAAS